MGALHSKQEIAGMSSTLLHKETFRLKVSKRFLQSEVLGEVPFWRGAVRGEVFGEVCGEVFGLVLVGHSEQKKHQPKKSTSPQAKIQRKTCDEVLEGDPRQIKSCKYCHHWRFRFDFFSGVRSKNCALSAESPCELTLARKNHWDSNHFRALGACQMGIGHHPSNIEP